MQSTNPLTGKNADERPMQARLARIVVMLGRTMRVSRTSIAAACLLLFTFTAAGNDTTPASAEKAPPPASSKVKEVIVIFKTHFDIGFTHRVKDIVSYYRTEMIDRALAAMEQSKALPKEQQFAWTAPGWVMAKVMEDWPGQTPERRAKLDEAFRDGRFVTHAMPFTLESDASEAEEMARGLAFASALTRKTGKPLPIAAKVTDVPGQSNALATVLAQGGVKFLHMGNNWPAGFVKMPGLFWWEGPDGSRTLVMHSVNYGSSDAFWPKDWIDAGPRERQFGHGLVPPADWPYEVWPAIVVTPDNSGPPEADAVKAYFADAQKQMPGVKFRVGTLDEFAAAILKENPDLPVVKGQMTDNWIHGILSDPAGSKLTRETHPLLAAAEVQRTQMQAWDIALPSAKAQIATAYENLLLYSEHTFGGAASIDLYGEAFKKVDPKTVAHLEASWQDKFDYIKKAHDIAQTLTKEDLETLAKTATHGAGDAIVYNPLPWPRSEIIDINGRHVRVENVPASGYKTVPGPFPAASIGSPAPSKDPLTLENEFFKVVLDPSRGTLTSIVDKRTGREWLDSDDHGIGYFNERFSFQQTVNYVKANTAGRTVGLFGSGKNSWLHPGIYKPGLPPNVPYRAAAPKQGEVVRGAHDATLRMPGDAANHLPASELRVSLPPGQPFVDLELTIKNKAKDNWPEADWLRLPFKVTDPHFSVGRALGEMDPTKDILPGANEDMYTVGHGLTIADGGGAGIAVSPLDHPLVSLDRPGAWKSSRGFVPKRPEVFVNLYNNQWNTNFRYWFDRTWSSRVRVWTFGKDTPADSRLAVPALEARNPLQVIVTQGANTGTLPAERAGLTVSRKGVLVTAFGEDPDGHPGTLLRVWEMAGTSGNVIVTLPTGVKATKALPVDLRGEKAGEALEIKNGRIAFLLKAWAPASFLLEEAP